jgi:hypothetical protein
VSSPDDDDRELSELIEDGADLVGALVGATGGIVAGPPGAVAGAFVGITISRACKNVAGRLIGRERGRVGAAITIVEDDVRRRRQAGETPRDDGFFDERGGLRPDAEELLEGVLRVAAASYEERKVLYLGHLFAEVAFDASISTAEAQYIVRTADALTYQQLVALSVIAHEREHSDDLINAWVDRNEGTARPDPTLLVELDDLGSRQLVGLLSGGSVVQQGQTYETMQSLSTSTVGYGGLRLLPAGEVLVRLAHLDGVPQQERRDWVRALRGPDLV